MEEIKMKKCPKCGEEKPLTIEFFYKESRNKNGLSCRCKECTKKDYKSRKEKSKLNQTNKNNYSVYAHINKVNKKIYIGSTSRNTKVRWQNGKGYLNNKIFNNDIKKYGWDNFEHEIIASGLTKEEAENFEELLIRRLDATNEDVGYNIRYGGNTTECPENIKIKISNSKKGSRLRGKNPLSKRIFCEGKIFDCSADFADYYSVNKNTARSWLRGDRGMPQEFIDSNLHYLDESATTKLAVDKKKKVYCEGKIFNSVKECSEYYNIKYSTIKCWLNGTHAMPQQFKDMKLHYIEKTKHDEDVF